MEKPAGQPIQQPLTEQQKITNFVEEYNELCKRHGLQISAQPAWIPTNHGSFEMAVQVVVVKMEQKKE